MTSIGSMRSVFGEGIHVVSTLVLKISSTLFSLSHVIIFSRVEMLVDCWGGGGAVQNRPQ